MRVYLDSCIVVYVVEEAAPWASRVESTLRQGTFELCVSELVRLEARVGPVRTGDSELDARFGRALAQQEFEPLARRVFELATDLRAEHRLRTPDALHIAATISSGCEEFWTNDRRLDRAPLPLSVRVFDDV